MEREKTKLNQDDENLTFNELESADDNTENMELDAYNSDSDYADGYEKIHEQTELYKKLNPSLDEEEEDDFYDAEMLAEDEASLDEDNDSEEEWDAEIRNETVTLKDTKGIQEFHALSQVGHFASEDVEAAAPKKSKTAKKKTKKAKKKVVRKKAGKKKSTKKAAKKAGKKKTSKKTTAKKKASKSPAKKKKKAKKKSR